MKRRKIITAMVAVPAMGLLAACGSDSTGDSLQTSETTPVDGVPTSDPDSAPAPVETPSTNPADTPVATDPPADAEFGEVVLSYSTPGGFTTREFAFQAPPIALVTGDGTLISQAVTPAIYPGPLVQQHVVQTVSPAGMSAMLAAADTAGLLDDVDYASDDGLLIADAPTTSLTITADGTTYTHEAYALGVGGGPGGGGTESTPQRQALLDFLETLQNDPAAIFGADNLGAPTAYAPTGYQIRVMATSEADVGSDAVTESWPDDSGIDLANATECVEIDRDAVGDLFEEATQLTLFEQGGVTYQVTPRPAYPGSSC